MKYIILLALIGVVVNGGSAPVSDPALSDQNLDGNEQKTEDEIKNEKITNDGENEKKIEDGENEKTNEEETVVIPEIIIRDESWPN